LIAIRPIEIKWEPTDGQIYAVLYNKRVELYSVTHGEKPICHVEFECQQTSLDFISNDELIVGDEKGRLTYLRNVKDSKTLQMNIFETPFSRIRQVKSSPCHSFFMTLSTSDSKIALWSTEYVRTQDKQQAAEDLIFELTPIRVISQF